MTPGHPVDVAIGEATIAAVADLSTAELLSAITPEKIGELAGYSASSVRYRLNGSRVTTSDGAAPGRAAARGWSFDREQLLVSAVYVYRVRMRAVRERARDRTLTALATFDAAEGSGSGLEDALEAALQDYAAASHPRSDAHGPARLYFVALAAGEQSPTVARLLREVETDRRETLRPVVEQGLAALGREPSAGVTIDDIGDAIDHYLRGLAARRQFEPKAATGFVARAVLGIVVALTHPRSDTADL